MKTFSIYVFLVSILTSYIICFEASAKLKIHTYNQNLIESKKKINFTNLESFLNDNIQTKNIFSKINFNDLIKINQQNKLDQKQKKFCKIKLTEMSLNFKNCGRILFNTTSCAGLCESSQTILPNTNITKTKCSNCKIKNSSYLKINVKCSDYSIKIFRIKVATECYCSK